jgi:ribosomal protein S30
MQGLRKATAEDKVVAELMEKARAKVAEDKLARTTRITSCRKCENGCLLRTQYQKRIVGLEKKVCPNTAENNQEKQKTFIHSLTKSGKIRLAPPPVNRQ